MKVYMSHSKVQESASWMDWNAQNMSLKFYAVKHAIAPPTTAKMAVLMVMATAPLGAGGGALSEDSGSVLEVGGGETGAVGALIKIRLELFTLHFSVLTVGLLRCLKY